MLLAQLSDPHIGHAGRGMPHGRDPSAALRAAIAQLLAAKPLPDAVLVSGDLTERGTCEEYEQLRDLLAPLSMPVYLMVGNHDRRDPLREAFPSLAYLRSDARFVQYAFDAGQWRIVVLDSRDSGVPSGRLCADRLAWLERELAQSDGRDVAVFVHHQPFATGVPHVDRSRLLDAQMFARALHRHGRVRRILCGHVHRAMHASFAGCAVTTCPSVYFQFAADLREDGCNVPSAEMPGYQLHRFSPGDLLTYTVALT